MLAVLEALEVLEVLEEWVASEVPAVLENPGARVESAGPTGQRSGNTTRSTAAGRLMEIDPQPTDSAV